MTGEIFTVLAKCLPVIGTIISPLLVFLQTGVKNKATLMGLLSSEMAKPVPVAYLAESCIVKLHNCRPLPWFFLQKVLHFSNAYDIIALVSNGRRFLDLFELCETDQRFHFRYTPAFRRLRDRRITQWSCFGLAVIMLGFFVGCYWATLPVLFGTEGGKSTAEPEAINNLLNIAGMVFFAAMYYVFSVQSIVLFRADKRLKRINTLLSMNYPASPPAEEGDTLNGTSTSTRQAADHAKYEAEPAKN